MSIPSSVAMTVPVSTGILSVTSVLTAGISRMKTAAVSNSLHGVVVPIVLGTADSINFAESIYTFEPTGWTLRRLVS